MNDLLKVLQNNFVEIIDTEQLKSIKGGDVLDSANSMVDVD